MTPCRIAATCTQHGRACEINNKSVCFELRAGRIVTAPYKPRCPVSVLLIAPVVRTTSTMIGTGIPQYLFIQLCIFGLRAVTPLSVFYVSFSVAEHPTSAGGKFLLTWSIIETLFWVLVFIPRKRALQTSAKHPPLLNKEERKQLFWKCWDNIPNPEYYVSKWFLGARPGDVRRENVKEFFEWALLNRGTENEDELVRRAQEDPEAKIEEEEELNSYVDGTQTLLGRTIAPGRGSAKSLRLTIDEVNMLHRPVVWYLVRLHDPSCTIGC
jgi:hypothetical protein